MTEPLSNPDTLSNVRQYEDDAPDDCEHPACDAQIESLEAQLAQAEEYAREANEKNLALVNENLVLKAVLRAWEKEHGRDT